MLALFHPQVVRDLGFMIPDIFHLIIPIWLLRQTRIESFTTRPFYRDKKYRKDLIAMFLIITVLFIICSLL